MDKMMTLMGLRFLASKLDGKKTNIGGILLILLGFGQIIQGGSSLIRILFPDIAIPEVSGPIPDIDTVWSTIQRGWEMIGLGFVGSGIGHKLVKLKQ